MKLILMLCGMALAGVLGYMTEPSLRPQVTGSGAKGDTSANTAETPSGPTAEEAGIDLASLTAEQLPKTVILKQEIQFADASSGLTMTVAAGSPAKLVRIDGENAVVRPGVTAYTIQIPVVKTDLVEQLIANPPPPPSPEPAAEPTPEPEPAPEPAAEPAPEPMPEPAAEPAAEPAVTATEEAAPEPEPMPETAAEETMPEAAPTPQPEPTPAPEATPAPSAGPANAVTAMQESVRNKQVNEFTFDQVLEWTPGPAETVDGEQFETGTISYKAETIFGVKTIQAKALIKNGKVQRWIWPKSGMEIK